MAKTLYVGPILASVTERDLTRLFAQYGTVTKAQIPSHPALGGPMGFGFVEMADGADDAIGALNGANFEGSTITVNEAQGPKQPGQDRFSDIIDRFDAHYDRPGSQEFRQVVNDLTELAEAGHLGAAQQLAEVLALPGPYFDPESAYKWYYIALSQEGYTVQFDDHNHTPPYYCGPVGDFRNESMVSNLVVMLGFDKVRSLDGEAARWLAERG